jgi:hypothetical protein
MKESLLRDLLGSNLVKLVNSGLQGVYPFAFASRPFKPAGSFSVESPVVLSQLAISPKAQVLVFLIMETDSMLRASMQLFPKESRDDALKLIVSANAEVLNFVTSRVSWLMAKLEGISGAEVSPPRIDNYSGGQSWRVRGEEGLFQEFWTQEQALSFRLVTSVQALLPAESR